jgi:DNA-binding response OmpR family regulator
VTTTWPSRSAIRYCSPGYGRSCAGPRAASSRACAWGALEIDAHARRAGVAGNRLPLSKLEFDLLLHLASAPTRVFGKQELLRDVWGYRAQGKTRSVDAHACRLRKKLALAGAPHLVVNVRGVGYRLSAAPVAALDEHELVETAAGNGRAA